MGNEISAATMSSVTARRSQRMQRAVTAMARPTPVKTAAQRVEEAYHLLVSATRRFTDRASAVATIRARFMANVVRRVTPQRLRQEAARELRSENNHADMRAQEHLKYLQRQYLEEYSMQQRQQRHASVQTAMAVHENHCEQAGTATDPITLSDSEEPHLVSDTDSTDGEHIMESNGDQLMPRAVLRARDMYTIFQGRRRISKTLPHLLLLRRTLIKLAQQSDLPVCTRQVTSAFPAESHASMAARGSVLSGIHGDYDSAMQARLMPPRQRCTRGASMPTHTQRSWHCCSWTGKRWLRSGPQWRLANKHSTSCTKGSWGDGNSGLKRPLHSAQQTMRQCAPISPARRHRVGRKRHCLSQTVTARSLNDTAHLPPRR